jgi:hypothetical protein
LSQNLPKKLMDNLGTNENVVLALKSFTIIQKPNYMILTNSRIIFFDDRWIGYEVKSIPFQKQLEIRAERGIFFWGDIHIKSEESVGGSNDLQTELGGKKIPQPHVTYIVRRANKRLIEPFVEATADAINKIAIEPISIRKKASWFGKASWQFEKPEEFVTRTQQIPSAQSPATQEDPLISLKLAFARGEITEEEYRKRLSILKEN